MKRRPDVRLIFEKDLDAQRIMRDLSLFTKTPIIPGQTLLFIDEIQTTPNAIRLCDIFMSASQSFMLLQQDHFLILLLNKLAFRLAE